MSKDLELKHPLEMDEWGEEEEVRMMSGRWAEPDPTRYDRNAMQASFCIKTRKGEFSHFR